MIWFVVIGVGGAILRVGTCAAEDAVLQGNQVLIFEADPGVSDETHLWTGQAFIERPYP